MATLLLLALLLWAFVSAPFSWALQPATFEWSQLWTASLLHAHQAHLLSNAMGITLTGIYFEHRYGWIAFVTFVLLASPISLSTEYYHDPDSLSHIIGASGVAYALIGAVAAHSTAMQIGFLAIVVYPFFVPPEQLTALHTHLSGYLFGLVWGFFHRWFHGSSEKTPNPPASALSKASDQTSHSSRRALLQRSRLPR